MVDFTLQQIIAAVSPLHIQNIVIDQQINGVTMDSRHVIPGNLFIPMVGERVNGHNYVVSAIAKGCIASLWEKSQPNPPAGVPLIIVQSCHQALIDLAKAYRNSLEATFIGVTGSSGKTTTKDMVYAVASSGFRCGKTMGNQNNDIGVPLTILSLNRETQVAVVEMGIDNPGEMPILGEIVRPDVAILTSISESHMVNFGNLETICREKCRITESLPENGLFFYNYDTPVAAKYLKEHPISSTVKSYSLRSKADLYLNEYSIMADGIHFRMNAFPNFEFYLPLYGEYEISNALAAIGVGMALGLDCQDIQKGFDNLAITDGRESIRQMGNSLVIDSTYNSNPGSLKACLQMLNDFPIKYPKIAILGDMLNLGDTTEQLHYQIGATMGEKISEVWTVGELASNIHQGALSRKGLIVRHFADKNELKTEFQKRILEKNIFLVKGSRAVALEEIF